MIRNDVMIDIETLSTRPNAVILTIGAIRFNRNDSSKSLPDIKTVKNGLENTNLDFFYRRIDIQSCLNVNLVKDSTTEFWWSQQSKEAREEAFNPENRIDIKQALIELKKWLGHNPFIWAHGACFDPVILDEACKMCGMQQIWKYFNIRDTRTLYDIANVTSTDLPVATHHALADCLRQIYGVLLALEKLHHKKLKFLEEEVI